MKTRCFDTVRSVLLVRNVFSMSENARVIMKDICKRGKKNPKPKGNSKSKNPTEMTAMLKHCLLPLEGWRALSGRRPMSITRAESLSQVWLALCCHQCEPS